MKLLQEGRERKWYLVKEFETKAGLQARIHQCVWNDEVKAIGPSLHDFYTGYVRKADGDTTRYENADIEVHGGVTMEGSLPGVEGEWVGFDMAHLGDENKQSVEYAESECESLAGQMQKP